MLFLGYVQYFFSIYIAFWLNFRNLLHFKKSFLWIRSFLYSFLFNHIKNDIEHVIKDSIYVDQGERYHQVAVLFEMR